MSVIEGGDGINYNVLVKGNTLSKTWARKIMGRRKLGKFLNVLFDPSRAVQLNVSQEKVDAIAAIPVEDREAIFETQAVVCAVFEQFDRLSLKIARNYSRLVGRENPADVSQLESEARVGLLKAIRGYTNPEVKFVTYCYRVMSNEVSRYLQRSAGVTLTGANAGLLVKYKRKVEEMSLAGQLCHFDKVCEALELSPKQINRLKCALRSEVTGENELETTLAATLLDAKKDTKVDGDLIRRMEAVSLSNLEKFSFISQNEIRSMFPDAFPSLKDVAIHFDVTPQAASEALKRARKKLSAGLGDWNPNK